jgi:hydroxymethylbilane synthase
MWQARHVRERLLALYPQCDVQILGMTTRGDQILDRTLSKVGGKGLFVKELEVAMSEGQADLAVHSLKDVPMTLPSGFALAAVITRGDPLDAFVSNHYASLADLPQRAVVGTSSLRRQALIAARYPKLEIRPLRGNLDTRLAKLDQGDYAAIILAAAGLRRLDLTQRIRELIAPEESLPAPGQGAMAIEIRSDRAELLQWVSPLNDFETAQAVAAERTLSKAFGGSCQIPLAAFATVQAAGFKLNTHPGSEAPNTIVTDHITSPASIDGRVLYMRAMVATPDGKRMATAAATGPIDAPESLGLQIAILLRQQDAISILAECLAVADDDGE